MQTEFVKLTEVEKGWNRRADLKNSPGLATMENAVLTDRGGVATRPGTSIFGSSDTANPLVTSLYTAKVRGGTNVMLRASSTVLEYYNRLTGSWAKLKTGFTSGQAFGFSDHSRGKIAGSIDNNFYTYFGNAAEPFMRWRNESWGKTTAVLAGGELSIPVDTTLTDQVFHSATASATSTTTVSIANADWAADIWNTSFVVRITSGPASGEVRTITATTSTQITFDTIAALAGAPTFEIRMLKYPASGTIIDGTTGTLESYTAITTDSALTSAGVSFAHADDAPIALIPQSYPANPRGNIFATLFGQLFLSGSKRFPTTLYRAKIDDATSFAFSATRVAGEGDVIDIPETAPAINDLNTYEDMLIVGGESYVEQIAFTQDANDLPNRKPIIASSLVGPSGRSSKMRDDLLFANGNKEITSLMRVANQDTRPMARDIGWAIKAATAGYDFSSARTHTYKQFTLVACKETSASDSNDIILAYDNNRSVWVGKWNLPASCFTEYDGDLYMGSAASKEVYKLFEDNRAQDKGDGSPIGYSTKCATGWLNLTKDSTHQQGFDLVCVEGYIKLNTPVVFKLEYDWGTSDQSWTFDPSDYVDNILETTAEETLGVTQVGVTPLGVELTEDQTTTNDERRLLAYFKVPKVVSTYFRFSWEVDGVNKFFELTSASANVSAVQVLNEKYIIDVETT